MIRKSKWDSRNSNAEYVKIKCKTIAEIKLEDLLVEKIYKIKDCVNIPLMIINPIYIFIFLVMLELNRKIPLIVSIPNLLVNILCLVIMFKVEIVIWIAKFFSKKLSLTYYTLFMNDSIDNVHPSLINTNSIAGLILRSKFANVKLTSQQKEAYYSLSTEWNSGVESLIKFVKTL